MCALWLLLILCVFHHPRKGLDEKPSQIGLGSRGDGVARAKTGKFRQVQVLQGKIDKNQRTGLSGEFRIDRASDKASKSSRLYLGTTRCRQLKVPLYLWIGLDVHPIYWSDALAVD